MVGVAQLHTDALECFDAAVLNLHLDGLCEEAELDAFLSHEVVLVRVGSHFLVGTAIDHGDSLSSEAFGYGGAVDCCVSGSDDYYVSADLQASRVHLALFDISEAVEDVFF